MASINPEHSKSSMLDPRRWSNSGRVAGAAFLVILLPVLWYGPWVPLVDLTAFVGLDSYPPRLSYGPHHYYIFQITYILPLALSRILTDLGIPVSAQVSIFYLAQALVFFGVIWRVLELLVPETRLRAIFIALGTLAFWNGLFLWGGPLAFSLSAALLAVATFLSLREAACPDKSAGGLIACLVLLAVASHPFGVLFAAILVMVRFLFLARSRFHSVGMLVILFLYQIAIIRENPEPIPGQVALRLFSWYPEDLFDRINDLLNRDVTVTNGVFGAVPPALVLYFVVLGFVHLVGFICSPVVAVIAKEAPAPRMLATLNTLVLLLYLFAHDGVLISMWSQRILSFCSPITFTAGIVAPLYLFRRWRSHKSGASAGAFLRLRQAFPIALLALVLAAELPILRLGRSVAKNYQRTRETLLATGVHDSLLVVSDPEIRPFYLQCVPYLLFSDPEIVRRHLLLYTPWHTQPRHPSRLAEMQSEGGRPRYQAQFFMEGDEVAVRLVPLKDRTDIMTK